MLTGLVTTCLVTLIGCASWYQRRSRHGWVDELDMVRGDALTAPRGEMATAVAIAEASDARDRLHGVSMSWDVSATLSTGADPEDLHHSDAIQDEFGPVDPRAEQATDALFDTEIWTQPSPHPIRPSEMWHPGVGPSALACDGVPVDRAGASEGTTRRRRFARFRPVAPDSTEAGPGQDVTEGILATAPVGDVAPAVPHPSSGGLLRGPVSRRGRVDRVRPALPTVPDLHRADVWEDGPDRSPLPEARPRTGATSSP